MYTIEICNHHDFTSYTKVSAKLDSDDDIWSTARKLTDQLLCCGQNIHINPNRIKLAIIFLEKEKHNMLEQLGEMPGEASVPIDLTNTLYIWKTDSDIHPQTTRKEFYKEEDSKFPLEILPILFVLAIIVYMYFST